jgi:hypothetical protein
VSIQRYIESKSESGTYIFAPGYKDISLKMTPVEVYSYESAISSQVLVFYKSIYKASCFSAMSIYLDHSGDSIASPLIRFRSFPLEYDDLYVKILFG